MQQLKRFEILNIKKHILKNSFKKIDRKWENEIVEEIWESGFTFAFAEESANIGKLIERYIYLREDIKKETSQDIYETIKAKVGNIFELMKGYFHETAFLFFKENFIDSIKTIVQI